MPSRIRFMLRYLFGYEAQLVMREQRAFDLLPQFFAHNNPFNAVDLLPIFEKDHGRNTIDIPLAGNRGIGIGVQPGECHSPLVFLAYCRKFWIKYLAGATFIR